MSVEFVEPEGAGPAAPGTDGAAPRPRGWPARLTGTVAVLAGGVTALATRLPVYRFERTLTVVDFDRSRTYTTSVPVDAFGRAAATPDVTRGDPGAYGSALTLQVPDGPAYGPGWLVLAGLLVVLGAVLLARPASRWSSAATTGVGVLGGTLLGGAGAIWLGLRTVASSSQPQLRYAAVVDAAVWVTVAAGAVAVVTALVVTAGRISRRRA